MFMDTVSPPHNLHSPKTSGNVCVRVFYDKVDVKLIGRIDFRCSPQTGILCGDDTAHISSFSFLLFEIFVKCVFHFLLSLSALSPCLLDNKLAFSHLTASLENRDRRLMYWRRCYCYAVAVVNRDKLGNKFSPDANWFYPFRNCVKSGSTG